MTWSRLRSFVTVVETGSIRAAAARLSVTESAISAAVSALQAELGAALVERRGRGIQVTEAGLIYADYALDPHQGARYAELAFGQTQPGNNEPAPREAA